MEEMSSAVRMLGWSPEPAAQLLDRARAGVPLADLRGDFVVAQDRLRDGRPETTIATSLLSCRPYYWTRRAHGSGIVHGASVFDVARRAGRPWRWNDEAVRTLALIRHLVDDQTLHADVRRVPAGCVLEARDGAVTLTQHDALTPVLADDSGTDEDAITALLEVTAELPDAPLVALTAGLDSRALLAALMHLGRRPAVWTAGPPESTDVRVARAIAADLGLEHHTTALDPGDWLRHAPGITHRTGGAYPAGDWHSRFLFAGAAAQGFPVVVKGANGELARSFYADAGVAARVADHAPDRLARVRLAITVRRGRAAYDRLPSFLDPARGGDDAAWLPERLAARCAIPARPLDRLDHFYATQRVRHFVGMGVRLSDAELPVAAPFLDARWTLAAARLPRRRKLGGALHRATIARLAPRLLEHPHAGEAHLQATPPRGGWLHRDHSVGTSPFAQVLADSEVQERIRRSPHLDRFAGAEERDDIVDRADRVAMELLLTLDAAAEQAATPEGAQPAAIITTPASAAATPTA
ncbi:MAG: hypothetical protein JHC84_19755 [Solirubrobacteraceae bacterium]|nr:hypothetical protein [Solirubrobacteraceae bacterium]